MFASRARLLIATLWVGSLWTVGYLVAPTLFATLSDRVLAGTIAGSVFRVEAWLSIVCAIGLVLLTGAKAGDNSGVRSKLVLGLVVAMLTCTLVSHFGLQPFMAALREGAAHASGVMAPDARAQFGVLHGISSGLYLIQSLLGVALILKLR